MLRILPFPCAIMVGATARAVRKTERALTLIIRSQVLISVSWRGWPARKAPAMFRRTSIRPNRSRAWATIPSTSSASVRSIPTASRCEGLPFCSGKILSSRSGARSTSTVWAFVRRKEWATVFPRVPAAPVIITTWSLKSYIQLSPGGLLAVGR